MREAATAAALGTDDAPVIGAAAAQWAAAFMAEEKSSDDSEPINEEDPDSARIRAIRRA